MTLYLQYGSVQILRAWTSSLITTMQYSHSGNWTLIQHCCLPYRQYFHFPSGPQNVFYSLFFFQPGSDQRSYLALSCLFLFSLLDFRIVPLPFGPSWHLYLKTTGHLFCTMSVNLDLFDCFLWLISGSTFLAKMPCGWCWVPSGSQLEAQRVMCPFSDDVNLVHVVKVIDLIFPLQRSLLPPQLTSAIS